MQQPGDIVITSPDAFHSVRNTGLAFNIAIKFDSRSWLKDWATSKIHCALTCMREKNQRENQKLLPAQMILTEENLQEYWKNQMDDFKMRKHEAEVKAGKS